VRSLGEVAIARIDYLELVAVDGDQRLREQLRLTAQHHEAATHVANVNAVVTTEVSYGLEVRRQTAREPHQFNIALAFMFQATARLNPVQVAVDIDLQQHARMIGRSTSSRRHRSIEIQ
jgi:predicted phage gp36 major capsid-like protein